MVASAKSDEASKISYARVLHACRTPAKARTSVNKEKCEKMASLFFLVKTAKKFKRPNNL
jgi:hypothetical protein